MNYKSLLTLTSLYLIVSGAIRLYVERKWLDQLAYAVIPGIIGLWISVRYLRTINR